MPIFVVLITVSLAFYVFYKIKNKITKLPIEKKWVSSKSSISLGLFVMFFGLNQIFLNLSIVGIIVGIVFMIVGIGSILMGYRSFKYFLPLAIEEAKKANG